MIKILLADDPNNTIHMERRLLNRENFSISSVSDGNKVMELAARERPDIILMGSRLSGLNREECCKVLKSDPALKKIPVIMVVENGQEQECLKAGCDDIITKPINKFELFKKLKGHIDLLVREHIRIPMKISASYSINGEEFPCKVLDMSESGMLIASDKNHAIKSSILLKFVVPTSHIAILSLGMVTRIVENITLSTGEISIGYGIKFRKMPNIGVQVIAKACQTDLSDN